MENSDYNYKADVWAKWGLVIVVSVFVSNIQLLFCDPFLNGHIDRSFLYFNARFAFALCFLMLLLVCVHITKVNPLLTVLVVSGIPFLQLLFKLPSILFSLTQHNFKDYHPDLFVIPFIAAIAIFIISKSKEFDLVSWLLTSIFTFLFVFLSLQILGAGDASVYISGGLSVFVSIQYSAKKAEKYKLSAALIFPILAVIFIILPTSLPS